MSTAAPVAAAPAPPTAPPPAVPGPAARAAGTASPAKASTSSVPASNAPTSASTAPVQSPTPAATGTTAPGSASAGPTAPIKTSADPKTPTIASSAPVTPTKPVASPTGPHPADLESNVAVKPRRRAAGCLPGFHNRPPFRSWLRGNCLDLLTVLLCALAALLIYLFVPPLLPRYFPLYSGIETSDWGHRHGQPVRTEYINTLVSALVSYLVPAAIMGAIALWRTRDFGDGNAALLGLGYALATTALFCSCIKVLIGGLRPNFLATCRPIVPGAITWTTPKAACPGLSKSKLKESQMSFPSGHAAAAFAGFGFLALYLNAKFKIFGHGRRSGLGKRDATATAAPSTTSTAGEKSATTPAAAAQGGRIQHWKLLLFALPWLIAILMSLSKIRDGWHHPIDVVVGALIGTAFAHMAFRMVYRSVYNEKDNHVPQESGAGAGSDAKGPGAGKGTGL